jgi:hypothetical protein
LARAVADDEAELAALPPGASAAQHAHLQRAREALAGGRLEKAWASLKRARQRAPLHVQARVDGAVLRIRASSPGAGTVPGRLEARFVPLPGAAPVPLRPVSAGEYAADLPLAQLGSRYDYARREYRPYTGALQVTVHGRIGERIAAGAAIVDIPRRPAPGTGG